MGPVIRLFRVWYITSPRLLSAVATPLLYDGSLLLYLVPSFLSCHFGESGALNVSEPHLSRRGIMKILNVHFAKIPSNKGEIRWHWSSRDFVSLRAKSCTRARNFCPARNVYTSHFFLRSNSIQIYFTVWILKRTQSSSRLLFYSELKF